VGRIAPEQPVEVLDDGEWIDGFAYYRQQLEDSWWYHVRVYHPPGRCGCCSRATRIRCASRDE
jgi:hypothetical protein